MARERVVSGASGGVEENQFNYALRPQRFEQYVGQQRLIEKLQIAVTAARGRGEPVEHTLLHGPPGLGKTTLSHVIANEVGSKLHLAAGPAITKAADLAGVLTRLQKGDVLFIDEIHRLPAAVEEYLYTAMEDFKIDITMDSGTNARTYTMNLQPFTLIGATTRIGLMTGPMRDRFGIREHLEFYNHDELLTILRANCALLKLEFESGALEELAARSRGTPRIANRLLRRVRDFSAVKGVGKLTLEHTRKALDLEAIDARGLDEQDRQFLYTIMKVYDGGPAGIEAVAATMGDEVDTLVDVVEPYLLQQGLVTRTRQGRRVTAGAYEHLRKAWPERMKGIEMKKGDGGLFEGE